MSHPNQDLMNAFTEGNVPDLDVAVLGALELFKGSEDLPPIDVSRYKRPLVVGSGNAEATGRIIFEKSDAVFASESTFEEKLKGIPGIDGVVLVSASGGKHAPIIAKCAKQYKKHVTLITNNSHAAAAKVFQSKDEYEQYVFPKNREPYTYNTSTYMGMILGYTKEDPDVIGFFIESTVDTLNLPDFSKYNKFYLIVPPECAGIIRMLQVKFTELFGRQIAHDVETSEYVKHATTVVPGDELFISFGEENTNWGKPEQRSHVPLPEKVDYAAMMAIGYYIIGKIQKAHPPYFKDNIIPYVAAASAAFGEEIRVIVE